jgi:hypothetical protein
MFVLQGKHITSPLRAQPVNAIYKFVKTVYRYNYRNSGQYPSSCLLYKTHDGQCSYFKGNKHITSPLRVQQVNAIYRFVKTVYRYNYRNSGQYPSSCLLSKTHDGQCWYFKGNTLRLRYEPSRLMLSRGLWRRYIDITIAILDNIHRPVFYLKHTMDNVRTSQETRYASATSPTG